MDMYCPRCGEPWDNECFHEEVEYREERGEVTTYSKIVAEFMAKGCQVALTGYYGEGSPPCEKVESTRGMLTGALYDMLGDDTDGIMSMLDDAAVLNFEEVQ